jgi:hypothetical protein
MQAAVVVDEIEQNYRAVMNSPVVVSLREITRVLTNLLHAS